MEEQDVWELFSALTLAATPLSNATQKTLPAFVGRPKMLIKKAYHLAIVAPEVSPGYV